MTDESIIKLYIERSEEALKATSEKLRPLIYGIAFNVLRSAEDAEECVNDVLLKAWNTIPPEPADLKAYIAKLARNSAIDIYKKRIAKKRGGGRTDAVIEELEQCIPSGGTRSVDDIALNEILRGFIGSLGKDERRIFIMRYWYSNTIDEIASASGYSCANIRIKLHRARNKLRKLLKKEGIEI